MAIFGEVYLNGYRSDKYLQKYSTQLDPPDEYVERIVDVSRETGVYVAMGISRRNAVMPGNLFDSAMLVGPQGVLGVYDKVHLANFVLQDGRLATEAIYWDVGKEYRVFDTPWCKVGLEVCRDAQYPEASRTLTLMGAELIINMAAAVEAFSDWWQYFLRTRADENQVWMAMASVVGRQKDFMLFGGSRVVSPSGQVVARAKDNVEDLVICEIDLDEVADVRALSHVLDRRVPRAYQILTAD